jgi:hypothetical protein
LACLFFPLVLMAPHLLHGAVPATMCAGIIMGTLSLSPIAAFLDDCHRGRLVALAKLRFVQDLKQAAARKAFEKMLAGANCLVADADRHPSPPPPTVKSGRSFAHLCLTPRIARRPVPACACVGS